MFPNSPNFTSVQRILEKNGFSIIDEIGRGAQGCCFLVFSQKYQMNFVCKCIDLRSENKQRAKTQFDREIFSLTHIIHPNIVRIYKYFEEENYLFMIIEYCEHGSLLSVLKQKNENSATKDEYNYVYIRKIMHDILSALNYCHNEINISHHDIKPANIVIDSFGRAKLCDFGLSFFFDQNSYLKELENTQTIKKTQQHLGGSLYFMCPQLLHCSFSSKDKYNMFSADIWAFGVTCYILLTGKYPFVGRTKRDVLVNQYHALCPEKIDNDFPPHNEHSIFDELPDDVPEDIKTVLERSLQFMESDRANAAELLSILDHSPEPFPFMNKTKIKSISKSKSTLSPANLLARTCFIPSTGFTSQKLSVVSKTVTQSLSMLHENKGLIIRPRLNIQ